MSSASRGPPRVWGFAVIAGWSACLCFAGLMVAGAFGFYAGSYYWFTVPFIVASGLCAVAAAAGLFLRNQRARLFRIATPFHALLILPCTLAMILWPGGDDGPGMAWTLLVGGGSVIAFVLAVAMLLASTRAGR